MISNDWMNGEGPVADRLADELADAIASGRLLPGSELPSQRALADSAGTSRTTVASAVEMLSRRGWVEPRDRARFVARLPQAHQQRLDPQHSPFDATRERAQVAAPASELSDAYRRAQNHLHMHLQGDGLPSGGLLQLRTLIAERFESNGLPTSPDQVTVSNGATGAMASMLDATRGTVLVEDPTYHGALQQIHHRRRRIASWQRSDVWDTSSLDHLVTTRRPGLLYAVPDFHNPTGHLASNDERSALAQHASRTTIVVDETLRDIHLDAGRPMPAHAASFHPDIVTIGGLSKSVWSGLRIGWTRHARTRDHALRGARDVYPVPIIDQLVAIELWPHLDEVIDARRTILRQQRDVMIKALAAAGLPTPPPPGGLVCWVDLGLPTAKSVAAAMNTAGHSIAPGQRFSRSGSYRNHVRLPFTRSTTDIAKTVSTLAHHLTLQG